MTFYDFTDKLFFPAPMMLLTNELQVEANATTIINRNPDRLRITLVIARARSPRCSIYTKKMNHVESEIKFCTIIHKATFRIFFSS